MLDYEKALKTIIAKRNEKGFVLDKDLDVPEETLEVLESKGLIICANQGDMISRIKPTGKGYSYFADKKQRLHWLILEHLFSFLGGFVTGIFTSVISWWIIQRLLAFL